MQNVYVEECEQYDLNTDLYAANTSVEMDSATRVHLTRNGG